MPRFEVVLAAALLATGCGTAEPAVPDGGPTSGPSPQASSSGGPDTSPRFPLAITRQGGVAGFSDRVTVQEDGSVRAVTKTGEVTCTLDAASLAVLAEAAAGIRDTDTPTAPTTPVADAMTVLIGAGDGRVPVDDPRLAAMEPVVTQLLAEVTGPAAGRRICP